MKIGIGIVLALSLVAACGSKKKGGDALAKMEEFQKKMCDCKDKACADKVNEEMTKWGTEMAKNASGKDAEKPDPELAKKSADIMTKYTECMTKSMSAGAGGSGSGDNKMAGGSGDKAGSGSGDKAGSGSDAKAGSGSGAGEGSVGEHRPGSAGDDGSHKNPAVEVKWGEKLPEHWVATGHQLDHVETPPKDAKWTAEFAHYVFDYGLDDATMPKDPKEYAALLEKSGTHEKITKTEKLKNGYLYESEHAFRYVIEAGDKRIHCGGSLYKDPEHDKIAKIRDGVVATARKLCSGIKGL